MLHVQSHLYYNQQVSICKWLYQENISFELAIEGKLAESRILHHPSPKSKPFQNQLQMPYFSMLPSSHQSQKHAKDWTFNHKLQKNCQQKFRNKFFPSIKIHEKNNTFLLLEPSLVPALRGIPAAFMAFYAAAEPPKGVQVPLPTVPSTHRLRPVWFGGANGWSTPWHENIPIAYLP